MKTEQNRTLKNTRMIFISHATSTSIKDTSSSSLNYQLTFEIANLSVQRKLSVACLIITN